MKKISILTLAICLCLPVTASAAADSYGWGFNKGKNGQPADAGPKFENMIKKSAAIYKGDPRKKRFI